jgi:hypothetical protein
MHRKVAAALVAAFALGVAGCGSAEPLTRAELVRQIETACREGQRSAQAQMRSSRGENAFIAAIISMQRDVSDEIDDLEPPDAARDDFDAFKQGIAERTELLERLESIRGREQIQRALARIEEEATAVTERVQRAARRLSVDGCF